MGTSIRRSAFWIFLEKIMAGLSTGLNQLELGMRAAFTKMGLTTASRTFGAEYIFNANTSSFISVSFIDSTHFLLVYYDNAPDIAIVRVGTISGSAISYGDKYSIGGYDAREIKITMLDSTHFVAVFRDADWSDRGSSVIGTISGDTLSFSTQYIFHAASTSYPAITRIDSTHFVVAFTDDDNSRRGSSIIGTISGDTISYGTLYVFNSGRTDYTTIASIDSTHFVVAYADYPISLSGTAIIGTISGGVISYGAEYVFNSGTTSFITVSPLDSTHFVVSYLDQAGEYGAAIIGTISDNIISYGSEYKFNELYPIYISTSPLDSTHFVVACAVVNESYQGIVIKGTVIGSTISYGNDLSFHNTSSVANVSISLLDSNHFVVGYLVDSNGTSIIGSI